MVFINFLQQIINGPTGFKVHEELEFVVHKDRDKAIAEWVIRCLANPDCPGSKEVLIAIYERRGELTPKRPARRKRTRKP